MVLIRQPEIVDPLDKRFNQDPFDPANVNSLWEHPSLQNLTLEFLQEDAKVTPRFSMNVIPASATAPDDRPKSSSESPRQESLYSTPSLTASTPPLTREPSLASSSVELRSPSSSSLEESTSSSTPASSITTSKAAARAAKRRARREINKEKRRAEEEAKAKKADLHGWEIALDGLKHPISGKRELRARRESIEKFNVPLDPQVATRSGASIPATDFTLDHNVASALVEELVSQHGGWSITFSDPSYRIWISAGKDGAISYKHVKGLFHHYAIVFGDPVCASDIKKDILDQFQTFCSARRWRLAMVGVGAETAAIASAARWSTIQFASEQVVNPQSNAILDGTNGKRMLFTVKKMAKDGVLRMYHPADDRDAVLEAFLQGVYDECYASKEAAKGEASAYSTKLHVFDLPYLQTYFYTVDADERPNGMAALMSVSPGRYLLDPVVAVPTAPAGTTDFLTVAAMGWLRRQGAEHMTFGLEPQRLIGSIEGLKKHWHGATRRVNAAAFDGFGFAGKKMLHDKFHPDPSRTEPLYVVLASSHSMTQADGAVAICAATHIRPGPVLSRLVPWSKKHSRLDQEPEQPSPERN